MDFLAIYKTVSTSSMEELSLSGTIKSMVLFGYVYMRTYWAKSITITQNNLKITIVVDSYIVPP